MVIGGGVPSWTKTIPGPKYSYSTDVIKPRQPVFSMAGSSKHESKRPLKRSASEPTYSPESIEKGYAATTPAIPKYSVYPRREIVIGGVIPSWVNSIPAPKYSYDTDKFKKRPPSWTLGTKLPDESDLMKVRSPGPIYGGTAIDSKKQAEVDSTRRRVFSTTFGIGPRWEGQAYQMVRSGAWARYNGPAMR